ncbi:GIY-YIG nuclease family protein [Thalassotalea fusca]
MKPKSSQQDKWEKSPGYLYIIGAGEPVSAIKIGVTVRHGLKSRLRAHQSSNHEPLRVMKLIIFDDHERPMIAAENKEKELHLRFAHLQRFQKGWVGSEWFTVSNELLAFVDKIGLSPNELDEIESLAKLGPGMLNTV